MVSQELLVAELNVGRQEVKTDGYSMSIGEIVNLYKDEDLELNPAYQRLFRWDDEQKTRFIESILLGIPLPPIFVAQKEGGKWSIVDGLQRVSTILQLIGELPNKEPLILTTCEKLPSLEGYSWSNLPEDIKRTLRRSKLGINIISTENNIHSQYELFQRLNTGGIHLEPQEIRNCLIIMLNESYYNKLNELKNDSHFLNTISLQGTKIEIEYHMELILRFFISLHNSIDYGRYDLSHVLFSSFLDKETTNLISDTNFDIDNNMKLFRRTFKYLDEKIGFDAFKRFNSEKNSFEGAFFLSSFEAIAPGIARNIDEYEKWGNELFIAKIKSLYQDPEFIQYTKRGTKAMNRFKGLSDFSKNFFSV